MIQKSYDILNMRNVLQMVPHAISGQSIKIFEFFDQKILGIPNLIQMLYFVKKLLKKI